MQKEEKDIAKNFIETFDKIDNLFHVKLFKSLSESKIAHIKKEKRFQPKDYYLQMRRLLLHMIYLYYVAYEKKTNFYLYPHLCINKWGTIFMYYSLDQSHENFMELVDYSEFKDNARKIFSDVWNIESQEQQKMEKKAEEEKEYSTQIPNHKALLNKSWAEFAEQFVEIFKSSDIANLTPKDIISKLQQTKHMKDNVLIVGILSSTIFPCVKFNKTVEKIFQSSYLQEPLIVNKFFNQNFQSEGIKDFVNCFIKFFKVLDDFKILGITTTMSDKTNPKSQADESLLTEFLLTLGRSWIQKEPYSTAQMMEQGFPTSNKSSEHDYSQGNEGKNLGQLKCQYFWSKRMKPRELTFRITISINKKIYPLYFAEIESVWFKLSEKWKVLLDENKQLSSFNPGFILLSYNKDTYQLSFTEHVKCQPFQNSLSQLILATDKLIIATLAMREAICYYERKCLSVQIMEEQFVLNDEKLSDLVLSVCRSVKNYYNFSKQIINSIQMKQYH